MLMQGEQDAFKPLNVKKFIIIWVIWSFIFDLSVYVYISVLSVSQPTSVLEEYGIMGTMVQGLVVISILFAFVRPVYIVRRGDKLVKKLNVLCKNHGEKSRGIEMTWFLQYITLGIYGIKWIDDQTGKMKATDFAIHNNHDVNGERTKATLFSDQDVDVIKNWGKSWCVLYFIRQVYYAFLEIGLPKELSIYE
jgi:hypothetical protein